MHTSEADAATPSAPTPKPKWAFARESFACGRCEDVIGQGEAYRVSTNPRRFGLCASCSIALDGAEQPAHIEDRSRIEELNDELLVRQASSRRSGEFARFTTPGARAAWKRLAKPKPSPATPLTPGSQPYADPRGQGRNRHGVAKAMRKNIEEVDLDWRQRRSGERDE